MNNKENYKKAFDNIHAPERLKRETLEKAINAKKAREATVLEYDQSEIASRKMNQLEAAIEIIHDCLEQLPELYQATTYAFYYDHMSVKTIAEVMDVEEGVILNRLNYVRKYIIKAMELYQEEKKEKVKTKKKGWR